MKKITISKRYPPVWMKVERVLAAHEKAATNRVSDSDAATGLIEAILLAEDAEVMLAICVDGQNRLRQVVEVARPVLIAGASGFILAHNHPSGDPTPSGEDVNMTRAVFNAARVVGLTLVDHIIIGGPGRNASMRVLGLLPEDP